MEIASDLAVARLVDKYKQPFKAFVEPEDPDDPDSGTCYKKSFRTITTGSMMMNTIGWPTL